MRTLATIALSFAAGVFAAVLLGVGVWQLWAAGACLLAGLVLLGLKRTMPARLRLRGMLILFALCGALVYTALFQALVQAPVTDVYKRQAVLCAGWGQDICVTVF